MTQESIFNIENTALESLLLLLSQDFDVLADIEEIETMDETFPLVAEMVEDYKNSDEYQPNKAYIVGKHLQEFGKLIQDEVKDDALIIQRLSDDTTQHFFGNKTTLSNRPTHTYPEDDPKLNRLDKDYKGIKKSRKAYRKKLRDTGQTETTDSFSISISKS